MNTSDTVTLHKTFKIKLIPTKEQEEYFNQAVGM